MGTALFPLFQSWMSTEDAWRSVCAVPAFLVIIWACALTFISDDSPKGNYSKLKTVGAMPEVSAAASMAGAAKNWNTWILFVQYGCCFGVELTMNNAAALYFNETLGQSVETSAAIASIFGELSWKQNFSGSPLTPPPFRFHELFRARHGRLPIRQSQPTALHARPPHCPNSSYDARGRPHRRLQLHH